MIDNTEGRPLGRRLALAGLLTAAVLAGGAGVAYATGISGSEAPTSGYATVVDESASTTQDSRADNARGDCPEGGTGGSAEDSSGGSSETPSDTPRETPSEAPSTGGDL
jgi:hypothetical protein